MAGTATRLLVIRHGQSEWNAQGRWQGQADPPLTDAGMRQAAAVSELLGVFDGIWASTLQRAALTAQIIAELLGVGPVQLDQRLQEAHYGAWQGLTAHEVEAGWPDYLALHRRPDDAEPFEAVVDRMSSCLRHIAGAAPEGEVLVVSHAGVIRSLRRALGASDHRFANLDGCWFHVHPDGAITVGDDAVLGSATAGHDTL